MTALACLSIAAGAGLFLWAVREVGWRRACGLTDEPRHSEEPRLVLHGPFRIVRHPVALAAILVEIGVALFAGSAALTVAAAAGALLTAVAVSRSEARRSARFGSAYRRYQDAVPLLLPRFGRRA